MTDKGWICLACILVVVSLMFIMFALWGISFELKSIAKRLGETNDKLQYLYYAQKETGCNVSRAIKGVYESMFANTEISIWRNDREEDDDD